MGSLECPRCGSTRIWKAGFYYKNGAMLQRYQCRTCGHRFSPELHRLSCFPSGKECLNTSLAYDDHRTPMETQTLQVKPLSPELTSKLVDFAWFLKKEGNKTTTIKTYSSVLRKLSLLGADLHDPESVKAVLATADVSHNTKAGMVTAYSSFLKWLGAEWKAPKYRYQTKIPFLPLEQELDQLIAGTGKTTSVLLQTLKETAMRIGEAMALNWTDINFKSKTISVNNPEKNGNPRILGVSSKCMDMLNSLPRPNGKVFGTATHQSKSWCFKDQRQRLAKKLKNPRLLQITFHTFRHWKATMEYHKTKDILHVKTLLGHKSIQSTMIYITLENAVFKETEDQYTTKVAHNIQEAQKLVEVGFEFHDDFGTEGKLYRKRK